MGTNKFKRPLAAPLNVKTLTAADTGSTLASNAVSLITATTAASFLLPSLPTQRKGSVVDVLLDSNSTKDVKVHTNSTAHTFVGSTNNTLLASTGHTLIHYRFLAASTTQWAVMGVDTVTGSTTGGTGATLSASTGI